MLALALQRLASSLLVAWLAMTIAFVVLRWVPGDALDATMARYGASPDEIAARRETLGLNDPIPIQYLAYLGSVLRGDWGESLVSGLPVTRIIAQNIGPTVVLALSALMYAVALGVSLGIMAATAPWAILRMSSEALSSLALSTPVYWTATLAIYLFTVELRLLPGVGGSGLRYLVLPIAVLGFHTAGSVAHVTAASIRDTAGRDFVRTARAKGLPEWDVLDHALRVALLPVITVIALQLGFLLSGTVITEMIFVRRGLGRELLQAVSNRDYPVIQGIVVLSALVYSLVNALADVVSAWLDPRISVEG